MRLSCVSYICFSIGRDTWMVLFPFDAQISEIQSNPRMSYLEAYCCQSLKRERYSGLMILSRVVETDISYIFILSEQQKKNSRTYIFEIVMSVGRKPNIFAPVKLQKMDFMTEILRPYFGTHPYHDFPELEGFVNVLLANECLKKLYDLTIENLSIHSYQDAIFFCDKLLTLSNCHLTVVYLMGECYFRNGDYKKVHSLFETHKTLQHNNSFQLLAARALLNNKQYDQCLKILSLQLQHVYFNRKLESLKLLIKAQCYDAQENKIMAIDLYQECLRKDSTNVQAFNRLFDYQLVTGEQKIQLLRELDFSPEDEWLRKFYESSIQNIDEEQLHHPINQQPRKQTVFQTLIVKQNIDILCIRAKFHHQRYQTLAAHEICLKAIKKDPLCFDILPIYSACLLDLGRTGDLYYCAHKLVENYSNHPVSWFAVGAYYFNSRKYEVARKYFQKSIMLDRNFIYAWMGMAHSFAIQDESDQAMSIYRTIARLFPGSSHAHMYMGMEYIRTNNLKTAILSLNKAKELNPDDPLIYSELGVICYKQKNYYEAKELQLKAYFICQPDASSWVVESILTNLAHSYRKLKDYKNSVKELEECICLNSKNPQTYFSLAFVFHLNQQIQKAISFYHKFLRFKQDNPFAQDLLCAALAQASEQAWELVQNA